MIGSLVRWFGRRSSGRGAGSAPRFTPQLEALECRALPGGCPGGVLVQNAVRTAPLGAKVGAPSHMIPHGGKIGISGGTGALLGITPFLTRSAGEEIPQ